MRKISANYLYTGTGKILKFPIIELNEEGKITNIIDNEGVLREEQGLEFYSGVLTPGFVNAHCHLELSHMKSKITKHSQLHNFIQELQTKRRETPLDEIKKQALAADKRMRSNGIVAVGDITNDNYTLEIKKKSAIKYINFIEIFGTKSNMAETLFAKAKELQQEFQNQSLEAYIVPHAPYSLSKELFRLIKENSEKESSIISIHNQETLSENELFATNTGKLFEMFKNWGTDMDYLKNSKPNSLEHHATQLSQKVKTLLIHNTFTSIEDVEFAKNYFQNLSWVLCPNANLFIENKLPEINNFRRKRATLCLGTDSLASNEKLSILSEMIEIQRHFPFISFNETLKWATLNGATALGLEKELGSIEIGKKPGINLIQNFDYKNRCLKENSEVQVLV